MSESVPASAKGVDVPERITRAIVAAKERFHAENPDRPNGFTLRRAIEAARAQWRLERPAKVNGRDVIFDAIVTACGGDLASLTPSYSAQVAKAKKEIVGATPDVTADEIIRRTARYRAAYRDAACTPLALAKHWPEFPLPRKAVDLYKEPGPAWRGVLRAIGHENNWDEQTVNDYANGQWHHVPSNLREQVYKRLT